MELEATDRISRKSSLRETKVAAKLASQAGHTDNGGRNTSDDVVSERNSLILADTPLSLFRYDKDRKTIKAHRSSIHQRATEIIQRRKSAAVGHHSIPMEKVSEVLIRSSDNMNPITT